MTQIIPLDPAQNVYARDAGFRFVAKQDVLFEGRTIQKLTYRNAHSLIWKIGQVALAAFITFISFGLVFCIQKGIIWKETLALFKDRIIFQNILLQLPVKAVMPSGSMSVNTAGIILSSIEKKVLAPQTVLSAVIQTPPAAIPVSIQASIPIPAIPTPATIVLVAAPPLIPTVVPVAPISPADLALKLKKQDILKKNPEYGSALQAWEKAGVSLVEQIARLEELKQYAFGTDKWVKYFGDIAGTVPPLPEDIVEICDSMDHSATGKKVKDTHVLVLIPEAIMVHGNRFKITFESLGELVKIPKGGGRRSRYNFFFAERQSSMSVKKSHWALMKKEVIPGSKKQTFARQVEIVEEYSNKANVQYSVPNATDVAACCFMNFVCSGNRLFDTEGPDGWTYTRCQKLVGEKYPIVVGGFAPEGLHVYCSRTNIEVGHGVAALRVF